MKSIFIITFSSIQHDARVSRQIQFLASNFKLTVAAFDSIPTQEYTFVKLDRPKLGIFRKSFLAALLLFRIHPKAYNIFYGQPGLAERIDRKAFDLIIANDIESLPLAFELNISSKIILDAHEYSPRQFEDKLSWRIFFQPFNKWICKEFIHRVSAMTTIGRGIAKEYKKNYKCDPIIINNAAWINDIAVSETIPGKIRMIHHGGATVSRQLEIMIEMMSYLDDRFSLDLMLIVPEMASKKTRNYIKTLQEISKNDSRIRFVPPVKSKEVVQFINQYDLGIILVPPINFNYANGLPNKLFEFIQAKLAVGVGPLPEIAEVVSTHNIGIVSDDFTAKNLAEKLSKITDQSLIDFKKNAVLASKKLSAESNSRILNDLVKKVLESK